MNQVKTVALLGLMSGLLVSASYWLLGGIAGATIGIFLAALANLGAWYYSDRIALAAYAARSISPSDAPQLYQIVERLCDRARLPVPQLYLVPSAAANAFATGRDPEHAAVALTAGILSILPEEELEGVIAHELSHVRNRDTLTQALAATIAAAISFLAQIASYGFWFLGPSRDQPDNANPIGLLLTIILAPIAATVIQLAISRTREFSADATAAKLTRNPRALARALERLENNARNYPIHANPAFEPLLIINPFSGELFANLFSTHPSCEARIKNLLQIEREISSRGNLPIS